MLLNNQEYIDRLGLACPHCHKTEQVESNNLKVDGGVAWAEVNCNACQAKWVDEYTLVGYNQLVLPDVLNRFEEGICIHCGGDDVECLENCTQHKCVDCGYTPEQDYSILRHETEYHGGE